MARLLLVVGVARVGDDDLKAGGQEDVVEGAQVVGEDAVGERGDDDADDVGARRGERARQAVGDIAEIGDGALDAGAKLVATPFRDGGGRATRSRR